MTRPLRFCFVVTFGLSSAGGGCSLETDHIVVGPASGPDSGSAAPDDAADAARAADAIDEREIPPPEKCRWQGYGIGPPGQGQCLVGHLTSHALVECTGIGGEPFDDRNIVGSCAAGAEEIQLYCCFADALPSPEANAGITPFNHLLGPTAPPGTRDDLLASAVLACEAEGGHLADWSTIYEGDSSAAIAHIRFFCR